MVFAHTGSAVLESRTPFAVRDVLSEAWEQVAVCRLCPAMAPHRKAECPGTTATRYLLLTETPSSLDRVPLLRTALRDVGHPRYSELQDLFFLAHTVRCVPRGRRATAEEVRRCRPFLDLELRLLRPRFAVALGARAASALLGGRVRIEAEHDVPRQVGETVVLPLLAPTPQNHPALGRLGLTEAGYRKRLAALFACLIAETEEGV